MTASGLVPVTLILEPREQGTGGKGFVDGIGGNIGERIDGACGVRQPCISTMTRFITARRGMRMVMGCLSVSRPSVTVPETVPKVPPTLMCIEKQRRLMVKPLQSW
jgi:hypothetical protein